MVLVDLRLLDEKTALKHTDTDDHTFERTYNNIQDTNKAESIVDVDTQPFQL